MNEEKLKNLIDSKKLVLDGAMGTSLQKNGLSAGEKPELLCLTNPSLVKKVHEDFIKAGANAVYTNTFGANRIKLGAQVEEVITSAVALAKEVAGEEVAVLLDVGPTGKLLAPYGDLDLDEAFKIFLEIVTAGKRAGVDGVVFETFSSLNELRMAVLASAQVGLTTFATMSFEASGRTFLGVTPAVFATTIGNMGGVSAIGVNCSLGPKSLENIVKEIKSYTHLPVIAKPNAGLPDGNGNYTLLAEDFAKECFTLRQVGASILGGCCGTTPKFIEELKKVLSAHEEVNSASEKVDAICSAKRVVALDGLTIETSEPNEAKKQAIVEAYLSGDTDYLTEMALEQEDDGAEAVSLYLDLLKDTPVSAEQIALAVQAISAISSLPIFVKSDVEETVMTALRVFEGRAVVKTSDELAKKVAVFGAVKI